MLATVAAFVLLTACGQGNDPQASATPAATEGTPPTCRPAGDEIALVAEGFAFDKDCLAAAANQPFTIQLDNRDPSRHNIEIYSLSSDGPELLFHGPMFLGPKTRTFDVDALPAGTYYFDCEAHTGMGGTFVVE
jgi:plastocyanin